MSNHYTAAELIAAAKACIAADAERMARRPEGYPRGAWRTANPAGPMPCYEVRDSAMKTRPVRHLTFDSNGNPYDLWVWSTGARPFVVEHVNLRADDANARLARYTAR